mmetsp:Transcript_9969/g.23763  ORF Transcript_9969/g.23763 Transcript_9969/m.23763 type:complete len:198 (-) Transcript_9969:60-653(-)|eukprot:CAMPEP_0113621156 /NCGR_PEP_ID=MMETSP0017_2-20120614/10803_1 /TAXON_ID=2856 /ORGANISM="Cylindrotheca closterium" /LENGTH=197 /DNA_ID=CAMNT_0000530879 /DNA_START=603 /DNA_END=1196 /DNA_ORIENTATION=+ /assembly_acc=CAM_ASM_000147
MTSKPEPEVTLRSIQPSDGPEVARIWKEGLSQTHQSICNPLWKCIMWLLIKQMEVGAMGKKGDVGPDGCNLLERWGGTEYPSSSSGEDDTCKLMIVAINKDGAIVGCCGVKRGTDEKKDVEDKSETDVFSIWRLSVSEAARGMGLGSLLMIKTEEWAKEHGGKNMHLFTGNPAASKFYQKIGYKKTSSFQHEKSLVA